MILEFLIRDEKYELASLYIDAIDLSFYADEDLFLTRSKQIVDSLRAESCNEALKWISQNRTKLLKSKCRLYEKLEMELRIQDFIQLLIDGKTSDAVSYSQQFLLPYTVNNDHNMNRVKQAMGAIVFVHQTDSYIYKEFSGKERWDYLINIFKEVFSKFYQMSQAPLLNILVKLGISTLKSNSCNSENKSLGCPTCRDDIVDVSNQLPCIVRTHTTLLCPYSHKLMDDVNYPLAFPNGNVLSKEAAEELKHGNKLKIIDPKSRAVFNTSELKRVYIT